jgi:general secretion pathway protein M
MSLGDVVKARWSATSPREQRLVWGALALVLGALVWWVGLAPAIATLRVSAAQQVSLDAQLQQMQQLQAQAKVLQAQPQLAMEDARRQLEIAIKPLGTAAQMTVAGERVSVTFKNVPSDAWAQWLTQVRQGARVVPSEVRLLRNAAGQWDGTLVLMLSAK